MWLLLLFAGVLCCGAASITKQLAIGILGRVGARLLYVLMWACFLGAGIDIARTYLYAPLLATFGVLMFYAAKWVIQSDRFTTARMMFRCALGCFVAGIVLLLVAIVDFAAWLVRSGALFVVALATSACSGDGNDDTSLWIGLFVIAVLTGLVLWTRRRGDS